MLLSSIVNMRIYTFVLAVYVQSLTLFKGLFQVQILGESFVITALS